MTALFTEPATPSEDNNPPTEFQIGANLKLRYVTHSGKSWGARVRTEAWTLDNQFLGGLRDTGNGVGGESALPFIVQMAKDLWPQHAVAVPLPRIEILHDRDPDSGCGVVMYVNGVLTSPTLYEDIDPGRGYHRSDWDNYIQLATERTDISEAFREACLQHLNDAADSQYIREDDQ